MADYALVGKKGNGKSKHAVLLIRDRYLKRGRAVATNLDLNLSAMLGPRSRCTYVRVPDKPTAFDLAAAGHGNPGSYDEDRNGGLFLDELATWLNTRTFNDKDRSATLDFFAHGRKFGWDTYYIMQDVSQVDKQVRESYIEYTVRHRRFDKVKIPFGIGSLLCMLFGEKAGYLPRFHVAATRMGTNPQDLSIDSTVFRGDDLHACYDTRQVFRPDYPHGAHSVLSPWHIEGRFMAPEPVPWLLRFWQALRGQPAPRPYVRPITRPDPVLVRVRLLASRLPPADATRLLSRFMIAYDRRAALRAAPGPA